MEVVSKHSGGKGNGSLSQKLEEGTQLLSPTTGNGQPDPSPRGSAAPAAPTPADGGSKAGGRIYQKLPSIATSALADAAQLEDVAEASGGAGGAQQGGGGASRNEGGGALEFAMV